MDEPTHVFLHAPWTEISGVLEDIDEAKSQLILDGFILHLAPSELNQMLPLQAYIGQEVAILKTDLQDRPFLIRLSKREHLQKKITEEGGLF
jgi:hypothetical protein